MTLLLLMGHKGMSRVTDAQELGNFQLGGVIRFTWGTFGCCGASITRATNGTIKVYRLDDDEDASGSSVVDAEDLIDIGVHVCAINTADNAIYTDGFTYAVWIDGAVIDGQTINAALAFFTIGVGDDTASFHARAGSARRFLNYKSGRR